MLDLTGLTFLLFGETVSLLPKPVRPTIMRSYSCD